MQNSGPWDPWLLVVENSRLFAQRTVPPKPLAWRSSNMVLHTQHACDVALGNLYVPAEAFLLMPESVTHPT